MTPCDNRIQHRMGPSPANGDSFTITLFNPGLPVDNIHILHHDLTKGTVSTVLDGEYLGEEEEYPFSISTSNWETGSHAIEFIYGGFNYSHLVMKF